MTAFWIGILFIAFLFVFSSTERQSYGSGARHIIEEHLNTTLPLSASDFHYYYHTWHDLLTPNSDFNLYIRFNIATEDGEAFLKSIDHMCFERPLMQGTYGFSLNSEIDWWLTDDDQFSDLWGVNTCGDNPYWHLIIDQSNSEIWIVYIEAYTT